MINSPSFKIVPQGNKVLESLQLKHPIVGRLNIATEKYGSLPNRFITELKNVCGKPLCQEIFAFKPESNSIYGHYIQTATEYRRGNFSFGEILRLVSIMLMKENKVSKFDINAKDTAIGFHAKYGFQEIAPRSKRSVDMSLSMEDVIARKDFFDNLFAKHGIDYRI